MQNLALLLLSSLYLWWLLNRLLSWNATVGASIRDSLVEPRALAYISRIAYISHAQYITSLRPRPLQSTAQRLVDSSNTYVLQPPPPSRNRELYRDNIKQFLADIVVFFHEAIFNKKTSQQTRGRAPVSEKAYYYSNL